MVTRVHVLMASHNRRASTVRSVLAILEQASAELAVDVFITDDGSTDGTWEELQRLGERVHCTRGDGSLYWAASMAMAERRAVVGQPDFLLWLNDDTFVDQDALETMVSVSARFPGAIIVGATRDPVSGELSYGGRLRLSRWHPQRLVATPASRAPERVDTFNGNLVLVPWATRLKVGPIDDLFPHAYADDDYGLRATGLGVDIIQAPGTLAICARGQSRGASGAGLGRWRSQQTPKGLPLKAQARFLRRHAGRWWPLVLVGQQVSWILGRTPGGQAD